MIFFGLRQAVEDCPAILRVLDTKKQVVGTHRSRKHNLQHPYAPKFPVFHEKNGHKWPFSGHILTFFGFVQAVEGSPPPILSVLHAKKASCMHARTTKAQSTASVCTKICYFSWKNCQKWPFLGQKLSILASDRHLQSPPPPHFEGAGCTKACFVDTPIAQTQFTAFLCPKTCHFSTKSTKNSHFFIKNCLFFLA